MQCVRIPLANKGHWPKWQKEKSEGTINFINGSLCSGYMRNDLGPPWHAQTSGPLLCAYISVCGRKRQGGYYVWGGCFGGQLKQKVSDSLFPFRAEHSASGQEGWLSVGWGWTMAGQQRALWARCLESYIQLKPVPGFLSREMYIRKMAEQAALHGLCYIQVFFCFFLKNPLWMLHDWVEISRCFLQMWANVKCSSSDLKCISWKFTKEQNCQKTKPDQ